MRLCEPHVTSGLVTGTSPDTAQVAALAVWTSRVLAQHGEPYGRWRLAAERSLQCLPRRDGAFECIARAAPCTLEETPEDGGPARGKRLGT